MILVKFLKSHCFFVKNKQQILKQTCDFKLPKLLDIGRLAEQKALAT